jgi:hypothetical protein
MVILYLGPTDPMSGPSLIEGNEHAADLGQDSALLNERACQRQSEREARPPG